MIVVLPMAGRGERFSTAGYEVPKPLIKVHGRPMFLWALDSIKGADYSKIIFIALKSHAEAFDIEGAIRSEGISSYQVILLDGVTEGQLATVMTAKSFLDSDEDILILSSDTYIKSNILSDIKSGTKFSGLISVALLPGDRWSFARLNADDEVDLVAEKVRISNLASTGIYYFRNGKHFLNYAQQIIDKQEKTRNEYYVIPVYQKYINAGEKIGVSMAEEIWDMGTPDALNNFLSRPKDYPGT